MMSLLFVLNWSNNVKQIRISWDGFASFTSEIIATASEHCCLIFVLLLNCRCCSVHTEGWLQSGLLYWSSTFWISWSISSLSRRRINIFTTWVLCWVVSLTFNESSWMFLLFLWWFDHSSDWTLLSMIVVLCVLASSHVNLGQRIILLLYA